MFKEMTASYAADRIELFANEGRLVQGKWHSADGGRALACMLGAIDDDINSTSKCPAQVMPEWCASLIVRLFDWQPPDRIIEVGRDFAAALRKTEGWAAVKWDGVRRKFLHATVSRALESARNASDKLDERGKAAFDLVQKACGDVLLMFAQGAEPTREQRAAADAAAADAAVYAARAAVYAAAYADEAADAADAAYAARAAANAAVYAARAAANAAANAAAYAARAAADAAAYAADAAADAYAAADAAAYSYLFATLIASINDVAQ